MKTSELDVLLDYTEELEDVVLDINSRLAQLEIREDSPLEGLQGKIKRVLAQRQEIEMLSQPERIHQVWQGDTNLRDGKFLKHWRSSGR